MARSTSTRSIVLRDVLVEGVEKDTNLLVDLIDVTLIDCASLSALVGAHRPADRRGHRVCLVAPRPMVRRMLAATMLDDVFPTYPDRRRAMVGRTGTVLERAPVP